VLVTGGWSLQGSTKSAELYDPAANTFSPAAPKNTYCSQTAVLLRNDRVLVTCSTSMAELYDPLADAWLCAGSMSQVHPDGPVATLLPSGKVLVTGGPNNVN